MLKRLKRMWKNLTSDDTRMPDALIMNCVKYCGKQKCPQWVILNHNVVDSKGGFKVVPEGKCAIAWIPSLLIEINQSLQKANKPDTWDRK